MSETFHDGRVALHAGDCLDVLKTLADNSVDSVCTDPPYHLTSIVKRYGATSIDADGTNEARAKAGAEAYGRASRGFMGKQWDGGDIAFRPELWREVMRVLKPGGHLLAFSGTRTYHRMACAIEDAGFEIRDQIAWLYGSGFPKSHDVSKAIDKAAGAQRKAVSRKVYGDGHVQNSGVSIGFGGCDPDVDTRNLTAPATDAAREWEGWGTALKPAIEPICLARKPLAEPTVAANVLKHGTGALHVDACRIEGEAPSVERRAAAAASGNYGRCGDKTNGEQGKLRANGNREEGLARYLAGKEGDALGRWPANVVHDGSPEVLAGFPHTASGTGAVKKATGDGWQGSAFGKESRAPGTPNIEYGDAGNAARFFYSAKADGDDRLGSKHPTVKPVELMRWLVRLVTPPGGVVLDPFAGTGTTGEAALRGGFRAVLIEREAEYRDDIARRMGLVFAHARERKIAAVRHKRPKGGLTLFGDSDAAADVAEAARAPPDGDGVAVAGASGPSMANSPCIGDKPPDRPHAMIEASE